MCQSRTHSSQKLSNHKYLDIISCQHTIFLPSGVFQDSTTVKFVMGAFLRCCFVLSYRVLWRRVSILVNSFVLVFSQDSDLVSMVLLPPAVNKKGIPHFCFSPVLSYSPLLIISLSLAGAHWCCVSTLHSTNPVFIKACRPCQYSPTEVGKKPSSTMMRWRNVLINLNKAIELSTLYVKLCVSTNISCTKHAHTICGHSMFDAVKLLTHV